MYHRSNQSLFYVWNNFEFDELLNSSGHEDTRMRHVALCTLIGENKKTWVWRWSDLLYVVTASQRGLSRLGSVSQREISLLFVRLTQIILSEGSSRTSEDRCFHHDTLCLLLLRLCVDPPEQCLEKSRKMPSCSGSESRDSRTWSMVISGLDAGLGPELVSWASSLEDAEESETSEPVQCVSSPGEGAGRMQGEGCWGWRQWDCVGLSASSRRGSRMEATVPEQTQTSESSVWINAFSPGFSLRCGEDSNAGEINILCHVNDLNYLIGGSDCT